VVLVLGCCGVGDLLEALGGVGVLSDEELRSNVDDGDLGAETGHGLCKFDADWPSADEAHAGW